MDDNAIARIPRAEKGAATLPIAHYAWTVTQGPKAWGELCHDDKGILVRLCAQEQPLIARAWHDGEQVYLDSCLELFIRPENDPRYLNFEINPLGAMIIGFGAARESRTGMLRLKADIAPVITIEPAAGRWCVAYRLDFAVLDALYGKPVGKEFRLNLFKCGGADDHYGMWQPVDMPQPDFHRPEFFGRARLD